MPAAPPADARRGVRDDPGRPSRPPGYGSGGGEARARPCSRQTLVGVALSRPPDVEPQALARTPMGECRVYLREGRRHCWRKRSRSPHHHATVSKRLKVIPDIPPRTRRATRRRGRRPRSRWCWGCAGASLACDTRRAGDGEGDVPPQGAGRLAWGRSGPPGAGAGRFGVSRGPTEG